MNLFTDRSKAVLLLWIRFVINVLRKTLCLYYTVVSVPCSLVITRWERVDLLALLRVMFLCVFVIYPYGVSGKMRYLIISIPDLCLRFYLLLIFGIVASSYGLL